MTSDKGRRKIASGAEIEKALSEWRREDRLLRWASRLSLKVCQYTGGQLLLLRHYQRLRLWHYIYSASPGGNTWQQGDMLKVQDIFFQFSRYGTQLDMSFFSLIIFSSCLRRRRPSWRARRVKELPAVVIGRITRVTEGMEIYSWGWGRTKTYTGSGWQFAKDGTREMTCSSLDPFFNCRKVNGYGWLMFFIQWRIVFKFQQKLRKGAALMKSVKKRNAKDVC